MQPDTSEIVFHLPYNTTTPSTITKCCCVINTNNALRRSPTEAKVTKFNLGGSRLTVLIDYLPRVPVDIKWTQRTPGTSTDVSLKISINADFSGLLPQGVSPF